MEDEDAFVTVASFRNDSEAELRLSLEMLCEEVVLSPGHCVDLLARPSKDLLPITICYLDGGRGLQVYPHREGDPQWHVRFKGTLIRAGYPTILAQHE